MSPVISERRGPEYFILHKGQHYYSYNIDRVFFEQLGLPEAKYNLEAGAHDKQIGTRMIGDETIIQ
jgi:UDP-N-acetylglucosamine 2-epimerase (non-hydrolysing)